MTVLKPAENQPANPFNPRTVRRARIVLIFCSVLFMLWVASLIVMYVKTVYPERKRPVAEHLTPSADNANQFKEARTK